MTTETKTKIYKTIVELNSTDETEAKTDTMRKNKKRSIGDIMDNKGANIKGQIELVST